MGEWKRVKIGQFLKERGGRYDPGDKPVQSLKRLNKIDFSGEIHLSDKGSKTDMIIVGPGDLVISGINVSKGAIAVYHGKEPITATIHYSSYIFDENQIEIDYFKRFVRSQSFIQALKDQVKGGIKTEIKPKHLLPLEVQLPDIESQKEIVSFFKGIENEMDDLSGEITHQQSFLKQLRQRILQEAIEGKLTGEWRKQNPKLISGDNHASKLLEQIRAEKGRLNKEKIKIKKDKQLPPIADAEKPFDLPDGWVWCRLGEITNYGSSPKAEPSDINFNTWVLDLEDIEKETSMLLCKIKFSERNSLSTKSVFKKGDVLYSKLRPYLDKVVVADEDGVCTTEILPLKCFANLNPNYFRISLKRKDFLKYVNSVTKGMKMPRLGTKEGELALIPLSPLSEQLSIVERVDTFMIMIDELEKQVSERKDQAEMLMQSVLRETFAG